ncbi:DUF262 domain-containing protein [Algibacter lectus]|uniref:DUF262 domain-containing protein n=1 Tax=Algibacter lectus TaxID=221126 RepID=UPI0026F17D75|nr:DUF262 domain-containing HNH endonuclease family protein [Algibacter lectus]MDO7135950.1 DUF262 domain-containing HNH endonuclease family protein [Algibacter lectus]
MIDLLGNNEQLIDIKSEEITLSKVVSNNLRFNIPLYQRLYVWGEEQINTLLGDIKNAFLTDPTKPFFLGGIVVIKNNKKQFDLIDGQQRFTTLWLISKFLNRDGLEQFTYTNGDSTANDKSKNFDCRLHFSVRDFANKYFSKHNFILTNSENEELKAISSAEKTIETYFNNDSKEVENINLNKLSEYIFKNIRLIATEMPVNTDENKVFEAMNNRGVQLQQHEILKSKLLHRLQHDPDREKYAMIWDACSVMDEYVEKSLKHTANFTWGELFPDKVTENEDKYEEVPIDILPKLKTFEEKEGSINLLKIISDAKFLEANDNSKEDKTQYSSEQVRSIITFPMLLLHTLRIFQFKKFKNLKPEESAEVKEKNLIKIFEDAFKNETLNDENIVADFFKLLWQVRVRFDKYVIKWVTNPDSNHEETHLIKKLYKSKYKETISIRRVSPDANEKFALLQSMLYHSQELITQYWLTPFLNKMLEDNVDEAILFKYLKKLDNDMFCNERTVKLKELSFSMLTKDETEMSGNIDFITSILNLKNGTKFASYWFYKLDFILWMNRKEYVVNKTEEFKKLWENYKMTAKNSVEHICPQTQNPHDSDLVYKVSDLEEVKKQKLDDFGNLVLLTSSMNSEYSNKMYAVKRTEFIKKKRLDSLKSDLIFENNNWNYKNMVDHRELMIKQFCNYLKN